MAFKCNWCGKKSDDVSSILFWANNFCSEKCEVEFNKNKSVEDQKENHHASNGATQQSHASRTLGGLICLGLSAFMFWGAFASKDASMRSTPGLKWIIICGAVLFGIIGLSRLNSKK